MEPKNNSKKKKKNLWLLVFLIMVIIIISIIIHLKTNDTFLSKTTKDSIDKYKKNIIESVTNTTNNKESTPSKLVANDNTRKILELQNTIKELQLKIDTTSNIYNNYNKNIQFVIYSDLLLYKLLSGGSFTAEIDNLIHVTSNPLLKSKLEKLKSYSLGIKTKDELLKNYQTVYKDTYLSYLKNQDSINSKLKYYFLYVMFIKQQHSTLLNDKNLKSILANVEFYIKDNNFKKAYAEFIKIEITPSNNTQQWLSDVLEKIESEDIINEMNLELNKYIALEDK